MLPLVIEGALKVGVTRKKSIINACLKLFKSQLKALDYKIWQEIKLNQPAHPVPSISAEPVEEKKLKVKLQPAGHILGSAYVEIDIQSSKNKKDRDRVVFSGDLGAPYAPLLLAPKSLYRAYTLVIESTYGDKIHQNGKSRTRNLQKIIEKAVADKGGVLIPAFSIGKTQELLYELEKIIHRKANSSLWQNIDIIIDSPMAAKFTEKYQDFKNLWDAEANREIKSGRHPLSFEQFYTVDSHQEHIQTVKYLAKRNKPAIVIAASGMCSGGRIVNYLKQFLNDKTAGVLFVGYQAQGSLGRDIQKYGSITDKSKSAETGYVFIDGKRIDINAGVHTISGYSAHADQHGLINFVKRMRHQPKLIKIVHGDAYAKAALAKEYQQLLPNAKN